MGASSNTECEDETETRNSVPDRLLYDQNVTKLSAIRLHITLKAALSSRIKILNAIAQLRCPSAQTKGRGYEAVKEVTRARSDIATWHIQRSVAKSAKVTPDVESSWRAGKAARFQTFSCRYSPEVYGIDILHCSELLYKFILPYCWLLICTILSDLTTLHSTKGTIGRFVESTHGLLMHSLEYV